MPLTRPASPWNEDGDALYQTPDGKITPVGLASSKQTKMTTIVAGESGGGKSVLINRMTLILAARAQQQLPFYVGIDKGFSSLGAISMLRAALAPDRQDEVLSIILRNEPEYCRNLLDIQLGLTAPLSYEAEFMENILTALCIDPSTGTPPNSRDTPGIIRRLIKEAFDIAREQPRRYEPGLVAKLMLRLRRQRYGRNIRNMSRNVPGMKSAIFCRRPVRLKLRSARSFRLFLNSLIWLRCWAATISKVTLAQSVVTEAMSC